MSPLPHDQHMARVSLSEEKWLEFRALAITKKRSVAAYLGHLVQKELGRATRAEQRREYWHGRADVQPNEADQIHPWKT
jgi:hypothetical protein